MSTNTHIKPSDLITKPTLDPLAAVSNNLRLATGLGCWVGVEAKASPFKEKESRLVYSLRFARPNEFDLLSERIFVSWSDLMIVYDKLMAGEIAPEDIMRKF